jgi:hypothetical protein
LNGSGSLTNSVSALEQKIRHTSMAESSPESEVNLSEFLSARARSVSDARLVLDAAVGLVVAVVALIWRPAGWYFIASAALCFAAFGGWGIADRELRERYEDVANTGTALRALRFARATSATLGGLAAGALLIELLGVALGTWIS